jgi:hypothetical protein
MLSAPLVIFLHVFVGHKCVLHFGYWDVGTE